MLYIHQLNHLTPKIAELESVYLVRDLKQQIKLPLTPEKMNDSFVDLQISETDQQTIAEALLKVEPMINKLQELVSRQDPDHEAINIQRTLQLLRELQEPLANDLEYVHELGAWALEFPAQITPILNNLSKLRTKEEKIHYNEKLQDVFGRILRNTEFYFNSNGIIGEGQFAQFNSLGESMSQGYLFHYTLEEELQKVEYFQIQGRLDPAKLAEMEEIANDLAIIRRGVERAYQINLRLAQSAALLYAFVKWMMNPR